MDLAPWEFVKIGDSVEDDGDCEIASLIEYASELISQGDLDSAAWRLADALLLIKRQSEYCIDGIHTPTGRGAMLDEGCK